MASWIDAITGPLKTAGEVAQGLVEVRDTLKFSDAVIKLQAQILAAQQGAMSAQAHQTAMAEKVRELESKVASFEAWETQKHRYQLQRLDPGGFVCALKPDMAGGEPLHYVCPKCFENRKRSILQSHGPSHGIETFECLECGAKIRSGRSQPINVRSGRGVV